MKKTHRIPLLLILAASLFTFQLLVSNAFSQSSYFTSQGCSGCHASPVVATCNGCHAHGTHSSSAKNDINVVGATNKASYAPGETVTVTMTGGYRTGWFRAVLYNQAGTEVARSTGNDSGMGSSATYPATLSAPAPAAAGTYTWQVAWYGNQYDAGGATFGAGWTPDATNPGHGYEKVNTNSFTVVAPVAVPTITSVAPNSLAQGAVNQSVTITGTNLTGGTVTFSNAGVTGGTATVSATSITLPVSVSAAAATGAGTVTVTTAGGSASSAFTVTTPSQNQAMINSTGYPTLSAAYAAAVSGDTIKIVDANIAGDLTIDKDITLDGGYDAAFGVKTGQPTGLTGIVTISTGSMTASDISIM